MKHQACKFHVVTYSGGVKTKVGEINCQPARLPRQWCLWLIRNVPEKFKLRRDTSLAESTAVLENGVVFEVCPFAP